MKYVLEKRFLFFLVAIFIVYIFCTQVYINQLTNHIEKERERVINIARTLELWKEFTINWEGSFDQEKLHLVNADINVTKVERDTAELGIKEGEKMYALYYSSPVNEDMYRRYFSELVLGNYFYLVTDSDGKIQDLFWSKP